MACDILLTGSHAPLVLAQLADELPDNWDALWFGTARIFRVRPTGVWYVPGLSAFRDLYTAISELEVFQICLVVVAGDGPAPALGVPTVYLTYSELDADDAKNTSELPAHGRVGPATVKRTLRRYIRLAGKGPKIPRGTPDLIAHACCTHGCSTM